MLLWGEEGGYHTLRKSSSHSKIAPASLPLETSLLLPPTPTSILPFILHPRQVPQPRRRRCPPIGRYPWQPLSSTRRRQLSWIANLPSAPASITCDEWAGERIRCSPRLGNAFLPPFVPLSQASAARASPTMLTQRIRCRLALLSHPPKISTQWASLANC